MSIILAMIASLTPKVRNGGGALAACHHFQGNEVRNVTEVYGSGGGGVLGGF